MQLENLGALGIDWKSGQKQNKLKNVVYMKKKKSKLKKMPIIFL